MWKASSELRRTCCVPDSGNVQHAESTYGVKDSIICGFGLVSLRGLVCGGLSLRMMSNMESLVFFTAMPSPSGRMRCAGGTSSQPLKHTQREHYTRGTLFNRGNVITWGTLLNRGNIITQWGGGIIIQGNHHYTGTILNCGNIIMQKEHYYTRVLY